jgi:hypothetical protein
MTGNRQEADSKTANNKIKRLKNWYLSTGMSLPPYAFSN